MKFVEKLSYWVFGYAIFYAALTLFYCCPRLLAEYSTIDVSHLAENFTFPLEIFAWGLFAVTAGYAGIDRGMLINKSMAMEAGQCDVGHPERLRNVIIVLLIIWFESVFLNFFMSHEFSLVQEQNGEFYEQIFRGVNLPLDGVTTALVSSVVIYTAGNKFIEESKDFSKKTN